MMHRAGIPSKLNTQHIYVLIKASEYRAGNGVEINN
jgi:hypothetical protein